MPTMQEPKQQQLASELGEAMKAVALMDVQTQAQEFAAICEEAAAAQVARGHRSSHTSRP